MKLENYLFGVSSSGLERWCGNSASLNYLVSTVPGVSFNNSISQNVSQLTGKRFIGLEFELENIKFVKPQNAFFIERQDFAYNKLNRFWKVNQDGSLRNNGKEFVTNIGVSIENLKEALEALDLAFKFVVDGSDISISSRCSVHVHYNLWDITLAELRSLVLAYMFVERAMYVISGNRYNNIFCVPCGKVSKAYWENLFYPPNDASEKRQWDILNSQYQKYAGLNLRPLFEYGTIEFRQHEGSTDTGRIYDWVMIIDDLITNSRKYQFEQLRELAQHYWDKNELDKLVKIISPKLHAALGGYNLNSLLELDIKYGLWASMNHKLVPQLDDNIGVNTKSRKKIIPPYFDEHEAPNFNQEIATTLTISPASLGSISWDEGSLPDNIFVGNNQ